MRLSAVVQVVLAPNPGLMTGPGTNTYVVGSGPAVVIDLAVDDDDYMRSLLTAAGEVSTILITHRHGDHTGGAARLSALTGAPVRAWGSDVAGEADVVPLNDGETVAAGGAVLETLHTPGHASDHLCFALQGTRSIFSGDIILGEGTSVIAPPDGNMRDFLASLARLAGLQVDRIYPGHFRSLDGGAEVIDALLAHRAARGAAIEAALQRGPLRPDEVVEVVYSDTPVALHPVAIGSVLAHLEMLEESGTVRCVDDRWGLVARR